MEVTLENNLYKAIVKSFGAELISFQSKENGIEYIWGGNPEYWGRHTPILFPHVGRLKNDTFSYNGVSYQSTQHGFARDSEFELAEHSTEFVRFLLKENEETLKRYPFRFELSVSYQLSDKGIETIWEVRNPGAKEVLYFGIGGHPAFNVPMTENLTFEDYYFEIEPKGKKKRLPFVPPYLDMANTYEEEVGKITLTHDLFHNDALVYETNEPTAITIKSDKSPHSLTLSYKKIEYVGLWSPYPKESSFVCIEPWHSFADTPEATGSLAEKASIQKLEPKETFQTSYLISVK